MDYETTITMPQDSLTRWTEGLRGGRYKQSGGPIYDERDESYSSLGVLEHVLDGQIERRPNGQFYSVPTLAWLYGHEIDFKGSLGKRRPVFPSYDCAIAPEDPTYLDVLAEIPFPQIADLIERHAVGIRREPPGTWRRPVATAPAAPRPPERASDGRRRRAAT